MRLVPRGLRARTTAGFALSALGLSLLLALATYQLARWYLLDQRQSLAVRQAELHAQVLNGQLASLADQSDEKVLESLTQTRSRALLNLSGNWYSAVVDLDETKIPAALLEDVLNGEAQVQRIRLNGTPYFVVGIPIAASNAEYFEFVAANEYERTLRTLAWVLTAAASVTTAVGGITGFAASRRVLRPLNTVRETARAMSEGDIGRRLQVGDDPDLEPVADAFNQMANSLQERIDRERRFTADVSHELRTPLTAMSAAVGLARRATTPDRTQFALDVVADQASHLQQLTLELLELARVDAGTVHHDAEVVDVAAIVRRQAEQHGVAGRMNAAGIPVAHSVNPTRFERVVANLLENAARYAGGATRVSCSKVGGHLRLVVDDDGPGVPASERTAIFERFHRGGAVAGAEHPKGTGLGLSLAEEYVRLEGGTIWVEDSPTGGARFIVDLPDKGPGV
ncbi:MAG TPA: HAMP domain-containing sensor histidine kinase [Ilumatobacteraceae bacterium]|nr:HAMP domain-containing sensor histidine kinase [Ilumatobacteraceae bacterium]